MDTLGSDVPLSVCDYPSDNISRTFHPCPEQHVSMSNPFHLPANPLGENLTAVRQSALLAIRVVGAETALPFHSFGEDLYNQYLLAKALFEEGG